MYSSQNSEILSFSCELVLAKTLIEWPFLLGFLCLNSSGVGTPHNKQMPGHYTVLTLFEFMAY